MNIIQTTQITIAVYAVRQKKKYIQFDPSKEENPIDIDERVTSKK